MNINDLDSDFEPEYSPLPEGQELELARAEQESHARRAAIGIIAGHFKNMVVLPRSSAAPLLRAIHADQLPFGGFVGQFNGKDIEIHHLNMVTSTCERYWPDVTDFLYAPLPMLEEVLETVGIVPAELPGDFMDPFERGLARYAIYGV